MNNNNYYNKNIINDVKSINVGAGTKIWQFCVVFPDAKIGKNCNICANVLIENDVIIGGEESGGLSIKGHIPEKDGLLANLLILETMAETEKSLVELQKEIENRKKLLPDIIYTLTDIIEEQEVIGYTLSIVSLSTSLTSIVLVSS